MRATTKEAVLGSVKGGEPKTDYGLFFFFLVPGGLFQGQGSGVPTASIAPPTVFDGASRAGIRGAGEVGFSSKVARE
jgi:hypothetical protein